MNADRPQHKLISETSLKCNVDDINKLLSVKKQLLEQPRIEKCASLAEAEWDEDLKLAKLTKVTKNLTKNFSHSLNKSLYLYPEECLCLLEMKCLVLKWNERKLSIKNAFSLLLAEGTGCTFEQCRTYGYLVKLGFRVFKHNNKLINNTHDSKDVPKLPDMSTNRKKRNVNYRSTQTENIPKFFKKLPSPKLKTYFELVYTPPSHYLPQNLQPVYDVYSYELAVISGSIKIIDYRYFEEQKSLENVEKENIVYKSQPTGMYPVYEKNIPQTIKSNDENIYEPRVKKLKLTETKNIHSPITLNTATTSKNDYDLSALSTTANVITIQECEDSKNNKMEINLPVSLSTGSNLSASNNNINFSNKFLDDKSNEENISIKEEFATSTQNLNLNGKDKNESDTKPSKCTLPNTIFEEELLDMHFILDRNFWQ
ncbi:uncharacterized protein LOC112600288 isoform X2 [Melanaphis sacchari]|uniref:uncharacterized protein LOC112600288 isoform X2 n=1 Tax=Melanaphis sacchari TaxID=742174 RepID=UPI000DC13DDB|nr:uncharacterized protein LOC112600288 isoform X2 [Melanaphis sacchari]